MSHTDCSAHHSHPSEKRPACGLIHSDGNPVDVSGCILPEGHEGPHEFVASDGGHWLWETDLECTCEHCLQCEGDYCTVYWRKPHNPP